MRKLLEIYPRREVSFEMDDQVFKVFDDLIKKTVAIKAPMSFQGIYDNLPEHFQKKITVIEKERAFNDIREFQLISLHREEVKIIN